jgi:methylenetetrahydrofolate reductase (NADPH)
VLDSESFLAWKDEAFAIMVNEWAGIYEQDSRSRQVLQEIHDDYYLVNVVDNDFICENFREMFREVFASLQSS